jgi:hypothetical protein
MRVLLASLFTRAICMPTVTPLGSGSCLQYLPTCARFRARFWHRSLSSMRYFLPYTGGGAVFEVHHTRIVALFSTTGSKSAPLGL